MAGVRMTRFGLGAALVAAAVIAWHSGTRAPAQDAPAAERQAGETRTWTDISGRFSREAEFVRLEEGKVYLRLPSGKVTSIPLKELSKKDRDWVRGRGEAGGDPSGGDGKPAEGGIAKGIATRVVVRSYKALLDDSVHLSKVLKQPALAGALPGLFVALTGGKPLEGFDITKPVVFTLHVDAKGEPVGGMVAVPVQGKEKFQKTLDAVFTATTTGKGKAYEIPMLGRSVYVKPGEGYFLISDSPQVVAAAKADPPAPVAVADVALESMVDAVPEEIRMAGLSQWEQMMAGMPVDPAAPEAQRRAQQVTTDWLRKVVRSLTTDGDRSTLEASIDPDSKRLSVAVSMLARSGTGLAQSFADYGSIRPGFVAAGDAEAIAWLGVSSPAGEWMTMALETVLGSGIEGMKKGVADVARQRGEQVPAEVQTVVDGVEQASKRMMATRSLEQEVVVSADAEGKPRIVARTGADGAAELYRALAKMVAIDGTVAADADGVLAMPVPPGAPPSMGLLDVPVRLASTDSAMVMGFGCPDNAPLKRFLTGSGSAANVAPVSAWIDFKKLWPIVTANDPSGLLADTAGAVGEQGMLRLDLGSLSDGIELRINVDDGVFQVLGRVAEKMSALQGGRGGPGGFPGGPGGFPGGPGGFPGGGFPGPGAGAGPGAPPAGLLPPTIQGFPVPPVPQPGGEPGPNQPPAPAP
ncbi:MAG: SHD1 domain-containing protein [Planctomycetaceae bacterium]